MKYDWIMADDMQAVRQMDETGNIWECVQVCSDGENGGFYHSYIDVSDYIGTDEFDEILREYGYTDWEEVHSLYEKHEKQIAAELIFESECEVCLPNFVRTDKEAMEFMLNYIKSGKNYIEFMDKM